MGEEKNKIELKYQFKLTMVQIDGPLHSNSRWMITIRRVVAKQDNYN